MSVFRIQKTKNYTVMSNHHLRDKNLTLKAKGLMSMMLSLPDTWNFSIAGLCSICKENQTAVKSALKELKTFGYLKVTKYNPDQTTTGRIEYVYDLFEVPQDTNDDEETGRAADDDSESEPQATQPVKKQQGDFHPIENDRQLNKEESNKEKLNTDELKKDVCLFVDKRTVLNDEVRKYFLENNLQGDVEDFIVYNLFLSDELFAKRYKSLAKKWSDNEYVDLPVRMYDEQYRELVFDNLPDDLVYNIKKELEDSGCEQIKYRSYKRLVECMDKDDFGLLSL